MPAAGRDALIDLDGYDRLCAEAEAGERLEYVDGEVFRMMVDGSTAHHALTRRLDTLIAERLAPGGPCASFRETMRREAGTARFYPDVFVSCGGPVDPDPDVRAVASAVVILEVLSPSTERYDRGRKWLAYQTLPDLRHFVLVAQDQRRIEAYHREGAGWRTRPSFWESASQILWPEPRLMKPVRMRKTSVMSMTMQEVLEGKVLRTFRTDGHRSCDESLKRAGNPGARSCLSSA